MESRVGSMLSGFSHHELGAESKRAGKARPLLCGQWLATPCAARRLSECTASSSTLRSVSILSGMEQVSLGLACTKQKDRRACIHTYRYV